MKQSVVAQFVQENLKTIFAYALSRVEHKEDAEDLTQDIVVAILQSADKLRNEQAFYGYVWAIAANTCKTFLRKRGQMSSDELDENLRAKDDVESEVERSDECKRLRRELALLSSEYRECTVAYYYDGLSCAQTAQKLGISLEMVKYYLFKTRKILKEGIAMEREFGEKSFRPAEFEFVTIFSGNYNAEYRNLFNRKLPGNILLSAYDMPMSVRELAVELGVASVYLEDELALLKKYHLIDERGGKYQTSLLIYTEAFTEEYHRTCTARYTRQLASVLQNVKSKLPEVKKICNSTLSDDRLLWPLLWFLMREGHAAFEQKRPQDTNDTIYMGATGVNYGVSYDLPADSPYRCDAFAGYYGLNESVNASFADFGVLPEQNRVNAKERNAFLQSATRENYLVIDPTAAKKLSVLFAEEIKGFCSLYGDLLNTAVELMQAHAPSHVAPMAERILAKTLFFRTVGLIGVLAVQGGALEKPSADDTNPAAVYLYPASQTPDWFEDCQV